MKKYIKIIVLCCIFIFLSNKSAFSWPKINKNTDLAVVVKKDGIWAVNINNSEEKILLKEGENYKYPRISKEGYIAFKNEDDELFISKISFNKKVENFRVSDKVTCYKWNNEGKLLFSKYTGGLYLFDLNSKSIEDIKEGKEFYSQIVIGKDNLIFALKSEMIGEESSYPLSLGIVELDLETKKEKIIVPYKPVNSKSGDLGLNPAVAAISKDGTKVIIWLRTNSASMTADGVPLGVYDSVTKEFKEINNKEITVLTYKDMIDVSPTDNNLFALINGSSRFMNTNKTLGVFDIENEAFKKITKDSEVAMTPSFSKDGNKIIYSASPSKENMQAWEKSFNQNIYEVDLENNEITKLTNSKEGFDFLPQYINDNEFIFIRRDINDKFSLMKGNKEGGEEVIIDEIISPKDKALEEEFWYYGHYNLNKIFTYKKINLPSFMYHVSGKGIILIKKTAENTAVLFF